MPGASEKNAAQALGDTLQADLFAGSQVGSGVHDQGLDAESSAALHFVDKGGHRAFSFLPFGCGQVDEVAVVGDHRHHLAGAPGRGKRFNFGRRQGAGPPLAGVFGEHLQGVAVQLCGPLKDPVKAAGDGQMSAEQRLIRFLRHVQAVSQKATASGIRET